MFLHSHQLLVLKSYSSKVFVQIQSDSDAGGGGGADLVTAPVAYLLM